MNKTPGFATLSLVHQCHERARWRYTTAPGHPLDVRGMELAVQNLPGIRHVRINPRASSLIVQFDASHTGVTRLTTGILSLAPTYRAGHTASNDQNAPSQRGLILNALTLLGVQFLPLPLRFPVSLLAALPVLQHGGRELFSKGLTSHVLEGMAVSISLASKDYLAANTTAFMLELGNT